MPTVLMIGGKGMKGATEAKPDEESDDEEPMNTGKEARLEAARAIIRGVKMNDPGAIDKALEAHYEACQGGGEDE
jgi:hypothetical protein